MLPDSCCKETIGLHFGLYPNWANACTFWWKRRWQRRNLLVLKDPVLSFDKPPETGNFVPPALRFQGYSDAFPYFYTLHNSHGRCDSRPTHRYADYLPRSYAGPGFGENQEMEGRKIVFSGRLEWHRQRYFQASRCRVLHPYQFSRGQCPYHWSGLSFA